MIPDVSQALAWLEKHPQALKGIQRGLERETLRVNADGTLATTGHPEALGSALTHKWITTDFAEALLEFITPVDGDIEHMLTFMRDLHRYTARNMGDERMWPLSMPCYIAEGQDIELAQYGTSNTGRFKTLYREGLKNRYGALMLDIRIFVDADADERILRLILRDTKERGRDIENIIDQYLTTVKPMHALFVEPTRAYADVVTNSGRNEVAFSLVRGEIARLLDEAKAGE